MARVLNKDGVAAKKHYEAGEGGGGEMIGQRHEVEKVRVKVLNDRSIFNGHVLNKGSVIELTPEDVANHRRHGVALADVEEDDNSEVVDVSEPFEAQEEQ